MAQTGWCEVSWLSFQAPWMSNALRLDESAGRVHCRPSSTSHALRLRSGLPTCVACSRPPNSHRVPVSLCCAALEISFSLLRLPKPFLNTCACLARAIQRYRRLTRTYLEYNNRKRNTHHSLIPTLCTLESPGGYQ